MFLAALAAVIVTATLTPLLAAWARRGNYLDMPNHRSSHAVPTPRIGGVALVVAVLAGLLVLGVWGMGLDRPTAIVMAGALGIAVLGVADDFKDLPALLRLALQIAMAVCVVVGQPASSAFEDGGWFTAMLIVLWLVTLINAYNFMDGIDGIAGLQAVVAGIGWMAVGVVVGIPQVAAVGLLLAAACSGFLLHNWQPAKVFMGDAGSGFIGFLFAALPLMAPESKGAALWVCAVLLMWPFLADTSFTLLRRASRGENVLSAHRSHLYQRLVLTGRSHRDVALVYAGLALLGLCAAVSVAVGHATALRMSVAVILAAAGLLWWKVVLLERAAVPPSTQK